MGDARWLFIVSAVVLAGLAAWVVAVLVRCPKLPVSHADTIPPSSSPPDPPDGAAAGGVIA